MDYEEINSHMTEQQKSSLRAAILQQMAGNTITYDEINNCLSEQQKTSLMTAALMSLKDNGGGGGAGSVVLTSVADAANRRRNWSFKDSNETFSYQNLLTHLENGEMPVIYIEELGIYQNVDYWGEKTLMDDSKVIDLLIEECYGVETLVNWHELTPVQEALSQQAPRELHVVVWEDGHVSIDRMSFLTQTLELEVSESDYYFNLSGTTVLNEEAGYIDFYDDQALAGGVLVELIDMAMALKVTNDDDGTKMANRANSSGVVQVEKNGNRIKRAIVTWEGVNSIAYDPNTGDPILTRYRGVFSVDSDDGAFTLKTTPIQDIPNGENMEF